MYRDAQNAKFLAGGLHLSSRILTYCMIQEPPKILYTSRVCGIGSYEIKTWPFKNRYVDTLVYFVYIDYQMELELTLVNRVLKAKNINVCDANHDALWNNCTVSLLSLPILAMTRDVGPMPGSIWITPSTLCLQELLVFCCFYPSPSAEEDLLARLRVHTQGGFRCTEAQWRRLR